MREVNQMPDTSKDAFKALTPEKLAKDYSDIVFALKCLKEGSYEQISKVLGWVDMGKCSRRLKELQSMQVIYKPGNKILTSRNRFAYVYKLVENGEKSVEPEKVMKGETVADISRKLVHPVQKLLFEERDFYLEEEDW